MKKGNLKDIFIASGAIVLTASAVTSIVTNTIFSRVFIAFAKEKISKNLSE